MEVLQSITAILALYFLLSGIHRIIKRESTITRRQVVPPHYAVEEEIELPGWRVVLSGIIRLIVAGALFIFLLRLLQ